MESSGCVLLTDVYWLLSLKNVTLQRIHEQLRRHEEGSALGTRVVGAGHSVAHSLGRREDLKVVATLGNA